MKQGLAGYKLMCASTLFYGFAEGDTDVACNLMHPVKKLYERGQTVLSEGDDAGRAGLILSGVVSATKITGDGDSHILALHERGDIMALDASLTRTRESPLTFTAVEDSAVLFLDISAAVCDEANPEVSRRLLKNISRMLADKCIRLVYKTEVLSKRSLRERIMTFLIIQQQKQRSVTVSLRMSREQFAQYLCVNRSALSRELGRMQDEGLIALGRDGSVTLLNGK